MYERIIQFNRTDKQTLFNDYINFKYSLSTNTLQHSPLLTTTCTCIYVCCMIKSQDICDVALYPKCFLWAKNNN